MSVGAIQQNKNRAQSKDGKQNASDHAELVLADAPHLSCHASLLVLDSVRIAVCDPAERHERSVGVLLPFATPYRLEPSSGEHRPAAQTLFNRVQAFYIRLL